MMARPVLVDLRNIYRPEEIARYGFTYESVGRARKRVAFFDRAVMPRAGGAVIHRL